MIWKKIDNLKGFQENSNVKNGSYFSKQNFAKSNFLKEFKMTSYLILLVAILV